MYEKMYVQNGSGVCASIKNVFNKNVFMCRIKVACVLAFYVLEPLTSMQFQTKSIKC